MFRNGERMGTIKFTQFQGRLFDACSFFSVDQVYIQGCRVYTIKYNQNKWKYDVPNKRNQSQ